ncbi:MAG: AAC(3) family N-acetyltransferase [Bacteroidetes bacterium]|nr:AAC(3) family N-acetyltransferase [Bacteroidota bacterium]MBL6943407.1 AAC(3) family N-acetyltransferase [Bacteroidales bacterium]
MSFADVIYRLLPESYFKKIRNLYYRINQLLFPPLSEQNFKKVLSDKLGIEKGMVVYVHSSIDKLNLDFSPYRLLVLLLDFVGAEGTLVFPCWHYQGRAEDYLNQPDAVFNVRRSPTTMGLLPELARRHKNAVRSLHPTTSIVAIGALAHELIDEHQLDIYPNGEKSPMYKIMQYNSRIIGLGEKVVSLSFVHVVEDSLKNKFPLQTLSDEAVSGIVIDGDKNRRELTTLVPHKNIQNRDTTAFFKKHIRKDICNSFSYKGVNYFTTNPVLLFNELKTLAEQGKTIYGY